MIDRFCILLFLAFVASLSAAEPYEPDRLEREVLVPAARDALQLEVLANGDVLFIEFWGTVKRRSAESGEVTTLGKIATHAKGEVGLLGFAAAKDYLQSGHFYVLFCPLDKPDTMRVSRFSEKDGIVAPQSEVELLSFRYDTEHVFHMGGAMWMDNSGLLYIGTGDNCHWNPGLPVDFRKGRYNWDAFRSAANTRDMRGKILRIRPGADGSYDIPKDNLFPDGKDGLPEIFAMGIRNPFRISFDEQTKILYIGDVGPNVMPKLGVTPVGYEEINATSVAANFGWPSFTGPNEPFPLYDFDTEKEISPRMNPDSPTNPSPNNTGIKNLPPAKPALIWYNNLRSEQFPELGSGGRSVMAGPVYRFDPANPSQIKLPAYFDGRLFVYEWMRNLITTARLNSEIPKLEVFQPDWNLRRPIDMKFGPDGALYMIEYGDQWWENVDSRIVRVVYRRGNRPPVARGYPVPSPRVQGTLDNGNVAQALLPVPNRKRTGSSAYSTFLARQAVIAGKHPLTVHLTASSSSDPDGDALSYQWQTGNTEIGTKPELKYTFETPGKHEITLTVSDPHGAKSTTTQSVVAGNARPVVTFTEPANGSFFDWDEKIPYKVEVSDTDSASIEQQLVSLVGRFQPRRFIGEGEEFAHPGYAQMRKSTCFACHLSKQASAGPPYEQVALKYANDSTATASLAQKVINGGGGVWGELPMPPHPQHTLSEARQMIGWILSLKDQNPQAPRVGNKGTWAAPSKPKAGTRADQGVILLTASFTDSGTDAAPALRGENTIVLHSRKKRVALYDEVHGMEYVEQVEGETGILGHFSDGDWICWRDINLAGIEKLTVRAGSLGDTAGKLELRTGSPKGDLLTPQLTIPATGEGKFEQIPIELSGQHGLVDLYVVCRSEGDQLVGVNWIEFQ